MPLIHRKRPMIDRKMPKHRLIFVPLQSPILIEDGGGAKHCSVGRERVCQRYPWLPVGNPGPGFGVVWFYIQRASPKHATAHGFYSYICASACQPASLWKELSFVAPAACFSDNLFECFTCIFVCFANRLPKLFPNRVKIMENAHGSHPGTPWGALGSLNASRLENRSRIKRSPPP